MLRLARLLVVAVAAATIAGCRDPVIVDDFGTSGYARIEGTVMRANGTPPANSGVFFSCGPDSPTEFGWSVPTDAAGRYGTDVDAPGLVTIPASGALRCRISAPGNGPPIVSVERSVQFSANANSRPLTVVNVIEH